MTVGSIAGLIAAGVFAVLVALLALPIVKLGRVFDELRVTVRQLNEGSDASANVSALSSLVASTVGQPLIKVASFSYGVRKAFRGRDDEDPAAPETAGSTEESA